MEAVFRMSGATVSVTLAVYRRAVQLDFIRLRKLVENVIVQRAITRRAFDVQQFASLRHNSSSKLEEFAPQRQGSMRAEEVAYNTIVAELP